MTENESIGGKDFDVEVFIGSVFRKEELWNQRSGKYRNRLLVDKAWDELSEQFSVPADELKKKWRYLRNTYASILRKQPKSRSGDAADNPNWTTWPYFNSMHFIKHQLKPRKASGNLSQQLSKTAHLRAAQSSATSPETENQDVEFGGNEIMEETTPGWFEESVSCISDRPDSPVPPQVKKPKISSNRNAQAAQMLEIEQRKLELLEKKVEKSSDRDEDCLFFESLLPHVKKLEGHRKLQLRMKIQQDVLDFVYNNAQQTYTASTDEETMLSEQQ